MSRTQMGREQEVRVFKAFLGAVASINGGKDFPYPLRFALLPNLDPLTPNELIGRLKIMPAPIACVSSVAVGLIALSCWPTRLLTPPDALPMHFSGSPDLVLNTMSNAAPVVRVIASPMLDDKGQLTVEKLSKRELTSFLSNFVLLDASADVVEQSAGGLKLEFIRQSLRMAGLIELR